MSEWHLDPNRAPTLADGDVIVFDEPGRICYRTEERKPGSGVDCRSHWFRIVKNGGAYALLVHHGGGEERIALGYSYKAGPIAEGMALMSSDARYWLMHQMLDLNHDAKRATESRYHSAFVNGRLKKRRVSGGSRAMARYSVWIEEAKCA